MHHPRHKNDPAIPLAILFSGVLIAGAIVLTNGKTVTQAVSAAPEVPSVGAVATGGSLDAMRPVANDEHVRGDPAAPIKIVEYSDPECPFCREFHATMKQVMAQYGASGKVAWVYRNFPLDDLHPRGRKEAEAIECAGDQGGNDKFWEYADRLYEVTPSNNDLDPAVLPKIATYIGLDTAKFNACLASNKYAQHVEDDVQNAAVTGGDGTPWSILVAASGKKYELSGAQSLAAVSELIDLALQTK